MWSFDIFDTCLVRRQSFPTDLFLELAERFADILKPALGSDYREIFREARVDATRLAQQRCKEEETTLEKIWAELVILIPQLSVAEGIKQELLLESESLHPIISTLKLVNLGREKYNLVVFVSDTYLPLDFLQRELLQHGFYRPGDCIILSNQYRATKHSGRLFKCVLDQLRIEGKNILHHGDNQHSDVIMAKAAGLRAKHLQSGLLTEHERKVGVLLKNLNTLEASAIVGGMRLSRVKQEESSNLEAHSLVTAFIGPFLWILAHWILRRAAADGIQRLYFFSRDCHGLQHIAKIISEREAFGIECRYLLVSRQALLLPATTEISPEGMPWLRRSWENSQLGSVLAKLDLDKPEVYAALDGLPSGTNSVDRIQNDQDWAFFWRKFAEQPLNQMLTSKIDQRRASALTYLRQTGFFDGSVSGIVDLGWLQTGHASLLKLLRMVQPDYRLPGYYLGLNCQRGINIIACPAQALFHESPHDRRAANIFHEVFKRVHLLEHVLNCAPHGTIDHYEKHNSAGSHVEAIAKPSNAKELETKGILFEEVRKFALVFSPGVSLSDSATRDVLTALLKITASDPPNSWTRILQHIDVSDDQNNRDASSLVKNRRLRSVIKDAFLRRTFDSLSKHERGYWPELSFNSWSKSAQLIYRILNLARHNKRTMLLLLKSGRNFQQID